MRLRALIFPQTLKFEKADLSNRPEPSELILGRIVIEQQKKKIHFTCSEELEAAGGVFFFFSFKSRI